MMKNKSLSCLPRTAVAYARYSSAGQRDVSIEQQLQDIRAFALREGYTIVHEYADHARSGYKNTLARSEFQAMIAAAASGSFDTVLTWKVDRFGRSRRDSAYYKSELRQLGVRVVYVMEPIPDGAAGVITEGMLETIAEWYSRNLSENVTRGMTDNANKCLVNGSHMIYGYSRGPDDRFMINEPEARVVRMIFDLYASGYSMARIVRILSESGLSYVKGKPFTHNSITHILSQERYLGVYSWGNIRIPGGMPAVIGEDLWRKAQLMKKKTGKHQEKSSVEFFLTGKAFCGLCHSPLIGDSGTSKTGATHYYYTCQSRKNRTGCRKKSFRKSDLEDLVVDTLLDVCLTDEEIEKIADVILAAQAEKKKSSPLDSMRGELRSVLSKIENINNAIADGIWTSSTKEKLEALEESAASLRASIASYEFSERQLVDRDVVLYFLDRFRTLDRKDPDNRRDLIRTFLNTVIIHDDHLLVAVNAIEGNASVPITDLEDLFTGSDASMLVPLCIQTSNYLTVCYRIAI